MQACGICVSDNVTSCLAVHVSHNLNHKRFVIVQGTFKCHFLISKNVS